MKKIEVESKLTIKIGNEKIVLNKSDAETLLYSLATALNKSINHGYYPYYYPYYNYTISSGTTTGTTGDAILFNTSPVTYSGTTISVSDATATAAANEC